MLYDNGIGIDSPVLNGNYRPDFYGGKLINYSPSLPGSGSPVQTNTAARIIEGIKILEETPVAPPRNTGFVQSQIVLPRDKYFTPVSIDLGRGDQSLFQKKSAQTGKQTPVVTTKLDEEKETRKILIYGFLLVTVMIGLGFLIVRIKV